MTSIKFPGETILGPAKQESFHSLMRFFGVRRDLDHGLADRLTVYSKGRGEMPGGQQ